MCVHAQSLSRVQLFVTLRTVAHQSPLTMEFSWEEHWSGLPFPPPGDLPNPGIELKSPALAGRFLTTKPPGKLLRCSVGSFKLTFGVTWEEQQNIALSFG